MDASGCMFRAADTVCGVNFSLCLSCGGSVSKRKGCIRSERKLLRDRLTGFPVWGAEGVFPGARRGPPMHGRDSLVSSNERVFCNKEM